MNDEKIILDLVIDVQKDFITGALANTQAQANVAHLAETARAHAQAGHWMFFTRDTHQDNYLTTREGRSLPIEHCIEGEDGWNFAPNWKTSWRTPSRKCATLWTNPRSAVICCPVRFWMN